MVILTYLSPAVFKMGCAIGPDFNRVLHEEWLKRYPKEPYQVVTEQEMVYPRLWEQYLRPCLEDIEAGRQEARKARYVAMVRELQRKSGCASDRAAGRQSRAGVLRRA